MIHPRFLLLLITVLDFTMAISHQLALAPLKAH